MLSMLLNISKAHFSAKAVLSRNAKREGKARREKRDAEEHPQSKEQQSSMPTETSTCSCLAADLQMCGLQPLRLIIPPTYFIFFFCRPLLEFLN